MTQPMIEYVLRTFPKTIQGLGGMADTSGLKTLQEAVALMDGTEKHHPGENTFMIFRRETGQEWPWEVVPSPKWRV